MNEGGNGVDFQALGAPAEGAVGRRVAAADDVDPEGLFGGRLEEVDLDVETVLLGELLHARQIGFDRLGDGGDLNAGVGAEDGDGFFALFGRNRQDGVEDERREHGAVLAAAVADEPGARVVHIQFPERVLNDPVG